LNEGYRASPASILPLGSPREIRHRLRETGSYERFFVELDRYLGTQQDLLKQLAAQLTGSVVLQCYERDYHACHRKSVASAFGEITGLNPKHIGVLGPGVALGPSGRNGLSQSKPSMFIM
jgi:uncharacterized protein (DUF488 family)